MLFQDRRHKTEKRQTESRRQDRNRENHTGPERRDEGRPVQGQERIDEIPGDLCRIFPGRTAQIFHNHGHLLESEQGNLPLP